MTDLDETKPTPKKKRKVAKKRAKPAAAATKPATGIYEGLTIQDCCNGCNVDGCVVSGKSYCAHPRKGGLHASEQQNPDALRRRREAERFLGKQKLIVE